MTDPRPQPFDPETTEALRVKARRALRQRLRGLRAALPPSAREERSKRVAEAVAGLEAWSSARCVALYASLSDELDTAPLLARARAEGRRVCLPVVTDRDGPLTFRMAWEGDRAWPLTAGPWGILEPDGAAPSVPLGEVDLVVVPGLAFDPRGFRLGYGRGYYDRTLSGMARAVRVGVAFEFQVIAEVPEQAQDLPVDWVVTDRRVLRAPERAPRGAPSGGETNR